MCFENVFGKCVLKIGDGGGGGVALGVVVVVPVLSGGVVTQPSLLTPYAPPDDHDCDRCPSMGVYVRHLSYRKSRVCRDSHCEGQCDCGMW